MTTLDTARLRLRPLTAADRDALYAIYADPEVARTLITRPQSLEEFRLPFEQMLAFASTLGMWAIVHRDNDRLIGRCGFYPLSVAPKGTPELAYLLARRDWNQGLATEAARRCLAYAFDERAWPEVVAMVRLGNTASARVLKKLGMEYARRIDVRGIAADLYRLPRASYAPGG